MRMFVFYFVIWQLSRKRKVSVRTFHGKVMVDIREFWNDDEGNLKPGKKGGLS